MSDIEEELEYLDEDEFYEESEEEDEDFDLIDESEYGHDTKPSSPTLEFRTHTTEDLLKEMSQQADDLKDLLQLNTEQTIILLQYYAWNSEKLIDEYTSEPSHVLAKVGITVDSESSNSVIKHIKQGFECPVCCDIEYESYSAKCGHEFGLECYRHYVRDRLSGGKIIKCPSCSIALTSQDINNISGEGSSDEVLKISIKEYVEGKQHYKWCPSPDCDTIIEISNRSEIPNIVKSNEVPVATCPHGHQFCTGCSYENHTPAPCPLSNKWIAKCRDDSETANWLIANTKACPKCDSSIEKNGGCNHMTCKKCSHEFCWICKGEWKLHNNSYYQCNRFVEPPDPEQEVRVKKSKRSLQKYTHYYNLFSVHDSSIKQDTARCATVEESVRELQEVSGISWIEAQFLAESASTLLRARRVLKWTNAIGYFCDSTSYFTIFENVQASLSTAVEGLSKMFEIEDPNEIVKSKLEFLNRQRFLIDRQNAMVGCVKEAIINKTLDMDSLSDH